MVSRSSQANVLLTKTIRNSVWRDRAAWIIVVALIVRGLIPLGFMPDTSRKSAGFFPLVICTGHGAATLLFKQLEGKTDPGKHQNDDSQHEGKSFCAYSVSSLFTSYDEPALLILEFFFSAALIAFINFRLVRLKRFGNASSRSPPL